MKIPFYKYHGTGNDFILIDNRNNTFYKDTKNIVNMCHRRFGIGADGLMLLENHDKYDFFMNYFNSDGSGGTMCGNGGRCIVRFAKDLGIIQKKTIFEASDGLHEAEIDDNNVVKLKMIDPQPIEILENGWFIHTGSPHFVCFKNDLKSVDVFNEGKKIRYSEKFKPNGTNVNFVEVINNQLFIRTYERGVEDETLACGTGTVASVLCTNFVQQSDQREYNIKVLGGELKVSFDINNNKYNNINLIGKAEFVFEGFINI